LIYSLKAWPEHLSWGEFSIALQILALSIAKKWATLIATIAKSAGKEYRTVIHVNKRCTEQLFVLQSHQTAPHDDILFGVVLLRFDHEESKP
jgi:hypothetical protein